MLQTSHMKEENVGSQIDFGGYPQTGAQSDMHVIQFAIVFLKWSPYMT